MVSLYLDSNVVFRLEQEATLLAALETAQRLRSVRVVIGWTTVWELAGAVSRKPDVVVKARVDAGVVLRLLEMGAKLARSPWNVAVEALRRPYADRWKDNGVLIHSSDEQTDAVETLRGIAAGTRDNDVRYWYERTFAIAERFREAECRYLQKIRGLAGDKKPKIVSSLTASLDSLEARGWLPAATATVAAKLKKQHKRPTELTSDWFGPLGRVMRASIGFSMLHATKPSRARVHPKDSDYADVMHVVGGGLVRRFVTADSTAKQVFDATWPSRSRSAMTFPDDFRRFVATLGVKLSSPAPTQTPPPAPPAASPPAPRPSRTRSAPRGS